MLLATSNTIQLYHACALVLRIVQILRMLTMAHPTSPPHISSVQECSKMHRVVRHHEIAETLSVVFWFLLALDILFLGGVFGLGEYL